MDRWPVMKCVVCENKKVSPLWRELKIVKCDCGHIYYDQNLSKNQIAEIYTGSYFNGGEYSDYLTDKDVIRKNFLARLKTLKRFQKKGDLLEIGSAYGFFLDVAQGQFNVEGYEICTEAATYASTTLGLKVYNADFLEANLNKKYDAVCMFDCIEHLTRPDKFIEKISGCLKQNGHLLITTGDIGKIVPKIRGKKWRLIHPPTHIHYFSFDSLKKLLEKNGLTVVSKKYPGVYRSFNLLFTFLLKRRVTSLPGFFWFNSFDIMEVVAVKS